MIINTNWYTAGQGMPRDEGKREKDMKRLSKGYREDIGLKWWPDSHLTLWCLHKTNPCQKHQLVYFKYEWFTVYQLNSNKILPYPPHTHTKVNKNGTARLPPWTHPQKLQAVQKKSPFSPRPYSSVPPGQERLSQPKGRQRGCKPILRRSKIQTGIKKEP